MQGVTSVSWCKHEASYLLSSDKDGKVMLWDAPQGRALGSFNAGLPGQSAHEVKWSPYSPGLFAITTLGGPEGHGKVCEGFLPSAWTLLDRLNVASSNCSGAECTAVYLPSSSVMFRHEKAIYVPAFLHAGQLSKI